MKVHLEDSYFYPCGCLFLVQKRSTLHNNSEKQVIVITGASGILTQGLLFTRQELSLANHSGQLDY
ncbi:hypothetical protein ACP3W2_25275, partial [Salmonella enterica]|uniref:hypothetical protein n=1 Tax=Salmonella enterica TaxID=28901 RepID=UPI003CF218CD